MSPKEKFDPSIHDENPDWTEDDFAKSRPASELPPAILAQFKNKPGRPKLENPKQPVKLRMDADVLTALRESGAGWQTRVNDLLRSHMRGGRFTFPAFDVRSKRTERSSQRDAGVKDKSGSKS